jgi:hypothetical protein
MGSEGEAKRNNDEAQSQRCLATCTHLLFGDVTHGNGGRLEKNMSVAQFQETKVRLLSKRSQRVHWTEEKRLPISLFPSHDTMPQKKRR